MPNLDLVDVLITGRQGPTAAVFTGTSDSSLTIGLTPQVVTLAAPADMQIIDTMRLRIAASGDDYMDGTVSDWDSEAKTFTFTPTNFGGSGTHSDWNISIVGDAGSAAIVFNVVDYGWVADGTDRSTEMQAVLDAAEAAGGGTIFFPPSTGTYRADSQMLIPNYGSGQQPQNINIALTGAGGGANWYGNPDYTYSPNASVLDLRYQGSGAKIASLGVGAARIEQLTFTDGSATANGTPFVLSTNTTLLVRNNTFVGGGSKSATVTITIAAPGVISWASHGLRPGNTVKFTTTGSLPTGLTAGTIYYVSATSFTANSFTVSPNTGRTAITTTGSQSGTHTCHFGGKDAIILGGTDTIASGSVDSPFQGYGTIIDGNIFADGNRGVVGLNYANSITVINNSWVHNTGTVALESDASSGIGVSQPNTGWFVSNNIFEMDVYTYGVKGTFTKWCTFGPNSFYDDSGAGSCYRFETPVGNESTGLCSRNTIINQFSDNGAIPLLSQYGNVLQLSLNAVFGGETTSPLTGATGAISTFIPVGAVVAGAARDATKQYHSQLTVIDYTDPNKNIGIGYDASANTAYIDAYNLAVPVVNAIEINPRGGMVSTGANKRASKTSNYPVTVADSSTQFDNLGASGTVNFTLPSDPTIGGIRGGVTYGFCVAANQTLQITVGQASATINVVGLGTTAGGGNISCSTVGSYIELTNYETANGRKWVAKYYTGTWTIT